MHHLQLTTIRFSMNHRLANLFCFVCVTQAVAAFVCQAQTRLLDTINTPAVVTLCPESFVELKKQIVANPTLYAHALTQLKIDADKALIEPVRAITEKTVTGPSRDPHDYVSLSPYRWPNPDTANGLPWIRKDGLINPMRDQYDLPALDLMSHTVLTLATGYYFLDQPQYAKRASDLIAMWFINHDTRMNPRVAHGQFIPGKTDGQCFGILETTRLFRVIDAAGLLQGSAYMTLQHDKAMKQWFTDYTHWLLTSELGKEELAQPNNHSNWAIAQIMVFAMYTGDRDTAMAMCDLAKQNIDSQFNADGSQPHELSRTRSLDYSEFSLRALLMTAWLGKQINCDLAHYTNPQGGRILKAMHFIAPHMVDPTHWPHKQISAPKYFKFHETFSIAHSLYPDAGFDKLIAKLPTETDPTDLFFHPTRAYQCSKDVN
jgi:hypothetical protein